MESSIESAPADDGVATVSVCDEIDFSNADELARRLRAAVSDGTPTAVVVDLAEASFFDSTGLGALIEGYRVATEAGIRFTVANPTARVRRLLTVTGLSELFGLDDPQSGAEAEQKTEASKSA
jgi:anti-sigma B factor antagonist